MGFNSTILIINDCLGPISEDPEFGKKVEQAITRFPYYEGHNDISSGHCCNAASVLSCQHSAFTALLAVGGNCGTQLSYDIGQSHHKESDKERILRQYADELGFYVVRKRKK